MKNSRVHSLLFFQIPARKQILCFLELNRHKKSAMNNLTVVCSKLVKGVSRGNGSDSPQNPRAMHILTGSEDALAQFKRDVASGKFPYGWVDALTGQCTLWTKPEERILCDEILERKESVSKQTGEPVVYYNPTGTYLPEMMLLGERKVILFAKEGAEITLAHGIKLASENVNNERLLKGMGDNKPAPVVQQQQVETPDDGSDDNPIDGLEPVATPKRGRPSTKKQNA